MDLERINKILSKWYNFNVINRKIINLKPEKWNKLEIIRMLFIAREFNSEQYFLGFEEGDYIRENSRYHDNNQHIKTKEVVINKKLNFNQLKQLIVTFLFKKEKISKSSFLTVNKKINLTNFFNPIIICKDSIVAELQMSNNKETRKIIEKWKKFISKYPPNSNLINHKIYYKIVNEI